MDKHDLLKNYQVIKLEKLVAADWNYKHDDTTRAKFVMEKLKNNLKRNGQIENLIVRELDTGYIEVVNGNHRYMALKDLGWDECVVYNLGKIDLATAKRIAIATNETKFENDPLRLASILKELTTDISPIELETELSDLPYSSEEMLNQVQVLDFDWNKTAQKDALNNNDKDNENWRTISLKLPEGVADQLEQQISRFKLSLYPDENPKDVSIVLPIEAMIQCLAQIPDDQLT